MQRARTVKELRELCEQAERQHDAAELHRWLHEEYSSGRPYVASGIRLEIVLGDEASIYILSVELLGVDLSTVLSVIDVDDDADVVDSIKDLSLYSLAHAKRELLALHADAGMMCEPDPVTIVINFSDRFNFPEVYYNA